MRGTPPLRMRFHLVSWAPIRVSWREAWSDFEKKRLCEGFDNM